MPFAAVGLSAVVPLGNCKYPVISPASMYVFLINRCGLPVVSAPDQILN